MLHLIKGAAKSGKTAEIFKRMRDAVGNGKNAMLIVPEQASFYNERRLQRELGEHRGAAQVVSFSRFADKMTSGSKKAIKPRITPFAESFMMSIALDEISDQLSVYKKNYYTKGFIEQVLSAVKELQNAGVTPQQLSVAAMSHDEQDLCGKISELALIYDSFEAVMDQKYISDSSLMKAAAQLITESVAFENTEIFIDDFGGFTAPELELIGALLGSAENIYITVYFAEGEDNAAFALAKDTENRLRRLAQSAGCETRQIILAQSYFASDAMAAIEKAQRREMLPVLRHNGGEVSALLCSSPYSELEETAAEIARLAASGVRYREMAVIARDLGRYLSALPTVFARFNIPFFIDERRDARTSLLTNGVMAMVRCGCAVRDADWMEAARSPLMGLSADEISLLENYCYVWSVRQSEWKKPFVKNPSGMTGEITQQDRALLDKLNELRIAVTAPVQRFAREIKAANGSSMAKGLWQLLQDINAAENIVRFADSAAACHDDKIKGENIRRELLDEQELLWQQLILLIELFDSMGETVTFTPDRVCELIDISFGSFDVAMIPRTLDQVAVGTAHRMRCEEVTAAFLLGAAEGEFPNTRLPEGLLSQRERKLLCEKGVDLLNDGDRFQDAEKMFCYRAVTSPTQRLFVSCPQRDISGGELLPSEIFARAKAIANNSDCRPYRMIWSQSGLERAIAAAKDESYSQQICAAGKSLLGEERVKSLCEYRKSEHRINDKKVAEKLFGDEISISPSRLEQFYKCPFSFFMQKGLKAHKPSKAELSPSNSGTLIHRILEMIVTRYGDCLSQLDDDELMGEIKAEADRYMAECSGDINGIPARMRGNIGLLCGRIFEMIKNLAQELEQSEFVPAAFELQVRRDGDIEPVVLTTDDGKRIFAEGTVDRVDIAEIDGQKYVRVIDYKSGVKKFDIGEVGYGLNLQMLIYLFSIVEQRQLAAAGALYLPAQSDYVTVDHGTDEQKVIKSVREQYKMNGLLLSDERVLKAMERQLEGRFIPYKQGGRGRSDASLYSSDEFERLKQLVYKKMTDMVRQLYNGEIMAQPLCKKGSSPCGYCDFKNACGFEQGDTAREQQPLGRTAVLGEEGEQDGSQNKMD